MICVPSTGGGAGALGQWQHVQRRHGVGDGRRMPAERQRHQVTGILAIHPVLHGQPRPPTPAATPAQPGRRSPDLRLTG